MRKKLTKKELGLKTQKMAKVLESVLDSLDDFMTLEVDLSLCDRDRYNALLKAEGRLVTLKNYLKKCRN